jgi:alpha-glucuronidase
MYESLTTMPDDLVLFMHHVPYTYKLHSGKTVIQSIYDSHYEGADAVEKYVRDWKSLKGRVDERRYQEVLSQLEYQAGQAQEWRDAVVTYFARMSRIPDAAPRANPFRMEAESMKLDGYAVRDVTPFEDASGGKSVECGAARCTATFEYHSVAAYATIRVRYFDQNNGVSHFRLWVGDQLVDEWTADDRVPSARVDSSSSARRSTSGIALRPGDVIRIEGVPDGREVAALDYVEVLQE